MAALSETAARACGWIMATAAAMAAIATLTCAGLAAVDVIGTWAFGYPLLGAVELTQLLMVVVVFCGLAAVRRGDHIAVDVVRELLPPNARWIADTVSTLVSAVVFGAVAWAGITAAVQSVAVGEFTIGPVPFPVYPAKVGLALGAVLVAGASLGALLRTLVSPKRDPQG